MNRMRSGRGAGRRRPANVRYRPARANQLAKSWLNKGPRSHALRFLLHPSDPGILESGELLSHVQLGKGVELLNSDDRNIFPALLRALRSQVKVDLPATNQKQPGTLWRFHSRIADDRKKSPTREFADRAARFRTAQQAFRRHYH